MKKILLSIAMMAFILSSCINNKKEPHAVEQNTQAETEVVSHENQESLDANSVINNNWMNEIQLDNGKKWIANEETNIGVQQMKTTLNTNETLTLDDYHNLASELNNSKNYVIKECTMKGASHDYLHVWLLPLIEKLDALSEAMTTNEASEIKQSIVENVNAYSDYFQ
ncbi:hypothetical protein [Xanthomarina sp. GH4-25]|uniref:hypothetical protein n=1 Tax=Xanthomarina sp. GH4-25 TaxID=3349335 RepID=UPI000D679163|nr:hypothetical protein DI383_12710 [Flavobacteriaceae bacterium LYZ1037]